MSLNEKLIDAAREVARRDHENIIADRSDIDALKAVLKEYDAQRADAPEAIAQTDTKIREGK